VMIARQLSCSFATRRWRCYRHTRTIFRASRIWCRPNGPRAKCTRLIGRSLGFKMGRDIPENCARALQTAALLRRVPHLNNAFIQHADHWGHCKGFLRYHLGLIVPHNNTYRDVILRIRPGIENNYSEMTLAQRDAALANVSSDAPQTPKSAPQTPTSAPQTPKTLRMEIDGRSCTAGRYVQWRRRALNTYEHSRRQPLFGGAPDAQQPVPVDGLISARRLHITVASNP
jgi:hypothetical protein